jgi:hypothetical protein
MSYVQRFDSVLKRAGLIFSGLLLAGAAQATPITYIFSGTATGSLYDTPVTATSLVQPFTAAAVTISAVSDTSSVQTMPSLPTDNVFRAFNQSLTIDVAGFGTFIALLPTTSTTEFVGVGTSRDIVIRTPNNSLYGASIAPASYNLQGPLAPLSATMFGGLTVVGTNRGNLHLTFASAGTFRATTSAVPAPATLNLFLLPLVALAAVARKRQ